MSSGGLVEEARIDLRTRMIMRGARGDVIVPSLSSCPVDTGLAIDIRFLAVLPSGGIPA